MSEPSISKKVFAALLGIMFCLSLLDLFLSWKLIGPDGDQLFEINPIAAWWLHNYGWMGMALFKLGVTVLLGAAMAVIAWRRPRTGERVLVFAIGAQSTVVVYSVFLVQFLDQVAAEPYPTMAFTGEPGTPPNVAIPPRGGRGAVNPLVLLLAEPTVREELQLPDEFGASIDELMRSAPRGKQGFRPTSDLASRDYSHRESERLGTLSAEQRQRLQQIAWQQQGPLALVQPEVGSALGFSTDQRQAVRHALDQLRPGRGSPFRGRRSPLEGNRPPEVSATQLEDRLWAVLTDDQRSDWKRLLGDPFTGTVSAETTKEVQSSALRPGRGR
jgi:hypothetical protein